MVKIFVGRLAPSVSSLQLRQLFEKYGPVSDCDILRDYGFVHMSNAYDAQKAIGALDKYDLCGSRLSVELSTSRSMKSCQMVVKNLPKGISHDDLHKLFKKFGTVTLCKINQEHAVVHMRFPSMATYAVRSLSGETIHGNVLSVEFANNTNKNDWQEDENSGVNATVFRNVITRIPGMVSFRGSTIQELIESDVDSHLIKPALFQNQTLFDSKQLMSNQTPSETVHDCNTSLGKPDKVSNSREKRRLRIKQGLIFLKSSMPWNSTAELYKTFLNQLKVMLLEEGLELFREGELKDAITQMNEAINISNYMRIEGIKGYMEIQDRLYLERAMIKLHLGDTKEALQDVEKAFSISGGSNQIIIRLKARLLAQCGQWVEAYTFMVKCQQAYTLDSDSTDLLSLLKQNVFERNGVSNHSANNKGTIGDGRSLTPTQLKNVAHDHVHRSNFNAIVPGNELKLAGNLHSHLQTLSNHSFYLNSKSSESFDDCSLVKNRQLFNGKYNNVKLQSSFASAQAIDQNHVKLAASFNQVVSSSSCLSGANGNRPNHLTSAGSLAQLYPTATPFRLPPPPNPPFTGASSFWSNSNGLNMHRIQNDSSLDKNLAQAVTTKLSATTIQNFPVSPDSLCYKQTENTSTEGMAPPTYTHFPIHPSESGYTGSVIGPAMLGIGTAVQSIPARPAFVVTQNGPIQPSLISTGNSLNSSNNAFHEILQHPMSNTHEFKLACSACLFEVGSGLEYRDHPLRTCSKSILLCRRRGGERWFKIRALPTFKNLLTNQRDSICSGKDCALSGSCTFAHSREEKDFWTLERKGLLNRTWLCKSLDTSFMVKQSLLSIVVTKHGGVYEFLCKICFQSKPRVISRFPDNSDQCSNICVLHRNSIDNKQLIHLLRDDDTVIYTAIRAPDQALLCEDAVKFRCRNGSKCRFAHSHVERDVWDLMTRQSLTASDFLTQAMNCLTKSKIQPASDVSHDVTNSPKGKYDIRENFKFLCAVCYFNGQHSEATADLKYCSCPDRHPWSSDSMVMLVKSGQNSCLQIRDFTALKSKFELCESLSQKKECSYASNCSFAHSHEELNTWLYLHEKQMSGIGELYDTFIKIPEMRKENSSGTPNDPYKSVHHCWLCNIECDGDQWTSHCSSDLHVVNATSDSDVIWKYRKPGGSCRPCDKHQRGICEFSGVPDRENLCVFAHSIHELAEWFERRQYVINRVGKARHDHLVNASNAANLH